MSVRIIRILEYTFENHETLEKHFKSIAIPLNGSKKFESWEKGKRIEGGDYVIRSGATPVETIPGETIDGIKAIEELDQINKLLNEHGFEYPTGYKGVGDALRMLKSLQ